MRTHKYIHTYIYIHTNVTDKDGSTKDKLKPLFVTIDPQRDGPAQLKAYLSDWHPKMIGLTGRQSEVSVPMCMRARVE